MTSTAKHDSEFDLEVFVQRHKTTLMAAGIAIVVGGAGFWFWSASSARKAMRSEQAYVAAERAYYSGNAQLAQTDLQRVIERYANTAAGSRAAILLARAHYDDSKPAEGVAVIREAIGKGASKPFRPAMHALAAVGLESQSKFDSAATAFMAAAEAEQLESQRHLYEASAARAFMSAGKKTEALRLWEGLAQQESSPIAAEANLRVAELKAAPAAGS